MAAVVRKNILMTVYCDKHDTYFGHCPSAQATKALVLGNGSVAIFRWKGEKKKVLLWNN
jgi:hypothetical protein